MAVQYVDIVAGRTIRERRNSVGITQMQLGERIGVTYQQIQKYETGANRMSISAFFAIAAALEIDPAELMRTVKAGLDRNGRPPEPQTMRPQ